MKPEKINDDTDLKIFTEFEQQMLLRNVHLEDFESRLKRFVFKSKDPNEDVTVKLKHLQMAFKGNEYLEDILTNKQSLDWRILTHNDIFVIDCDDRELESMEEDPDLTFRVAELQLLGLMYCKCEPKIRVQKFYEFFQPGLEDAISCEDKDIITFIPTMGRICYSAIIELYNQEYDGVGQIFTVDELLPEDLAMLDDACNLLVYDEDNGFIEKVFEVNTRVTQTQF